MYLCEYKKKIGIENYDDCIIYFCTFIWILYFKNSLEICRSSSNIMNYDRCVYIIRYDYIIYIYIYICTKRVKHNRVNCLYPCINVIVCLRITRAEDYCIRDELRRTPRNYSLVFKQNV